MKLSKKDRKNIVHALSLVLVRMQEDALSAIMYDSPDFGRAVMDKVKEFEELMERIQEAE
jgi:hypothetical protein